MPGSQTPAAGESLELNQTDVEERLAGMAGACCGANFAHCKKLSLLSSDGTNKLNSNHEGHHRVPAQCTSDSTKTKMIQPNNISSQQRPQNNSAACRHSPLERFFTLLLPFVIVFLLPTIRLSPETAPLDHAISSVGGGCASSLLEASHLFGSPTSGPTSDLLLALIRLPLDRIKLQWGGLALLAESKEIISSKNDLQEEETHMMLLAPAEHRSSYAPAGGPAQTGGYHYNQGGGGGGSDAGSQLHGGEAHAQVVPAPADYGPDSADQPMAGPGQGESTVVAESANGAQNGASSLQTRSDLPAVRALNVKCEKNHMTVNIVFDRPFYGMVFSKGHYNDQKCVHLPANSGQTSVNFDIHLGKCGMSSSDAGNGLQPAAGTSNGLQQGAGNQQQQPNGVFIENTIIIQYDPLVQEIYDQARKLRCTWYDYYEKSVTFRPYNVDMLDAVTANFLGDNIQCWMQIQVGKGPWSSEVAGIVKIGQTMTMVLAIKDDENRFDMLVRNCVAHDGKHQPIQLVDEYGCVARPKIMGKFQKVKNFGPAATVVSYAHFQAFKFPDSMNVHFQCVIQVCRFDCPEPNCPQSARGELPASAAGSSAGSLGGSTATGDYATSGTELVASKELVPHQAVYFNAANGAGANQSTATHQHHQNPLHQHHHGSNVNLKLDETQGRVQVKLDTSMMAALGSNGRPPVAAAAPSHMVGPLPPHLLHAQGQQQQEQVARSYLSPGLFRPPASSSSLASSQGPTTVSLTTSGQVRHPASVSSAASGGGGGSAGRLQHLHSEQQLVSYSPQFPMTQAASRRSAAYTNRLGESVAATGGDNATGEGGNERNKQTPTRTQQQQQQQHSLDQLAPYEAEYPLSLIASPRGFPLGSMVMSSNLGDHLASGQRLLNKQLHRVKREDSGTGGANKRQTRHLRPTDSTSVQTHKSIQVVSPDDVAFSLLELDDQPMPVTASGGSSSRRRLATIEQASSSVCFAASRFLWTVLVTITALISGIVIVTYVILRQRSQLEEKLSTVYAADQFQAPPGISFNYAPAPAASMVNQQQQQQRESSTAVATGYLHLGNSICSENTKRQQEEVHQRNKYLARLYSQFSPASYWR